MKDDRRAVARYRDKLPVEIDIDGQVYKDAASIEISLTGLRILCEGGLASSLFSKHIQVAPAENLFANLVIKIPESTGLINNIYCVAKVISVNRVSQSSYLIGLKFLEFRDDCQEAWQNYIANKN